MSEQRPARAQLTVVAIFLVLWLAGFLYLFTEIIKLRHENVALGAQLQNAEELVLSSKLESDNQHQAESNSGSTEPNGLPADRRHGIRVEPIKYLLHPWANPHTLGHRANALIVEHPILALVYSDTVFFHFFGSARLEHIAPLSIIELPDFDGKVKNILRCDDNGVYFAGEAKPRKIAFSLLTQGSSDIRKPTLQVNVRDLSTEFATAVPGKMFASGSADVMWQEREEIFQMDIDVLRTETIKSLVEGRACIVSWNYDGSPNCVYWPSD